MISGTVDGVVGHGAGEQVIEALMIAGKMMIKLFGNNDCRSQQRCPALSGGGS
jgi:hypothetical protein